MKPVRAFVYLSRSKRVVGFFSLSFFNVVFFCGNCTEIQTLKLKHSLTVITFCQTKAFDTKKYFKINNKILISTRKLLGLTLLVLSTILFHLHNFLIYFDRLDIIKELWWKNWCRSFVDYFVCDSCQHTLWFSKLWFVF